MKKSIKKACSIALALTTATAISGVDFSGFGNVNTKEGNVALAGTQSFPANSFVVESHKSTATVGDTYTIPQIHFEGMDNVTSTVSHTTFGNIAVESGTFKVEHTGDYTITYTTDGTTSYTTSVVITAEKEELNIDVKTNTTSILPKVVNKSYKGDLNVPEIVLTDKDGKVLENEDYEIETTVVSSDFKDLTVENGKIVYTDLQIGNYSVKYTVKKDGIFMSSKSVGFEVVEDSTFNTMFDKKELKFDQQGTAPTAASIGDEITLPTVVGKINGEVVNVSYKVVVELIDEKGNFVDISDIEGVITENNVFTAQKEYTINGKKYDGKNATYAFSYEVTDAFGATANRELFTLEEVKDSKKPTIQIVDAYNTEDVTKETEFKSVDYKLQNNFENGKNVMIMPIFATDSADDFANLTLTRSIRKSTQLSSEDAIYTEVVKDGKTNENANNYNKVLVFNMSTEFRDDKFDADTMIDVDTELKDGTYTVYYEAEDESGNKESKSYTFKVETSFAFDAKPEIEKFEISKKSAKTGETITFNAPSAGYADDDNALDERLNVFVEYKYENETEWTMLELNEDGKTYSLEIKDKNADYVEFRAQAESDAEGTYKYADAETITLNIVDQKDSAAISSVVLGAMPTTAKQNQTITLPTVTVEDDYHYGVELEVAVKHEDGKSFVVDNYTSAFSAGNIVAFSGMQFDANLAGNYSVVYTIKDQSNNVVVLNETLTVAQADYSADPSFTNMPAELISGSLEFGETITLPSVKVNDETKYDYTISYNGGAASLNRETEEFTPKAEGDYKIVYTIIDKATQNPALDSENNKIVKEFLVSVEDTTAPDNISVEWTLKDQYEKADKTDTKLTIPAASANDISGIDMEKSTVEITGKYTDKKTFNQMKEMIEDGKGGWEYNFGYNEEYTITYTFYDDAVNQNYTTKSYTIKIGDTIKPTLTLADNILPSKVKIDSELAIDAGKISFEDNMTGKDDNNEWKNELKISLTNPNGEVVEEKSENVYVIDQVGEYTLTISIEDNAGNKATETRVFTVEADTKNPLETDQILGTVLIVLSVLVLAGVVVYFVVSKKKLDKIYK